MPAWMCRSRRCDRWRWQNVCTLCKHSNIVHLRNPLNCQLENEGLLSLIYHAKTIVCLWVSRRWTSILQDLFHEHETKLICHQAVLAPRANMHTTNSNALWEHCRSLVCALKNTIILAMHFWELGSICKRFWMISFTSSANFPSGSDYLFFDAFFFGWLFGRFPPTTETNHGGFSFVFNVEGSLSTTDTWHVTTF